MITLPSPRAPRRPPQRVVPGFFFFFCQADQSQWKLAKTMAETAPVVIVNGVFVNGYMPFEPVYYFKPISGWGSVVRQYPGPFTAYLANSNKVVSVTAVTDGG